MFVMVESFKVFQYFFQSVPVDSSVSEYQVIDAAQICPD